MTTHPGLDSADVLMGKHVRSAPRFALLAKRHPEVAAAMPLLRIARCARAMPFRHSFKWIAADVAKSERLPLAIRGHALMTWRMLVYAEAL